MVRFKFLMGDVDYLTYGGKWVSQKFNNGEFDYWLVVELINWKESVGERDAPKETYNLSLSVVSPSEAGQKNIEAAMSCCGMDDETLQAIKVRGEEEYNEALVEILHSYGVHTPIWNKDGNNWKQLMKEARNEAMACNCLFGFYLDRVVAPIGTNGWESLKGTDPREVIKRVLEENPNPSADVKLVAKMSGM